MSTAHQRHRTTTTSHYLRAELGRALVPNFRPVPWSLAGAQAAVGVCWRLLLAGGAAREAPCERHHRAPGSCGAAGTPGEGGRRSERRRSERRRQQRRRLLAVQARRPDARWSQRHALQACRHGCRLRLDSAAQVLAVGPDTTAGAAQRSDECIEDVGMEGRVIGGLLAARGSAWAASCPLQLPEGCKGFCRHPILSQSELGGLPGSHTSSRGASAAQRTQTARAARTSSAQQHPHELWGERSLVPCPPAVGQLEPGAAAGASAHPAAPVLLSLPRSPAAMGQCLSSSRPAPGASEEPAAQAGIYDRLIHPPVPAAHGSQAVVSQAKVSADGSLAVPLLVRTTPQHVFVALFEGLGEDRRSVAAFCRARAWEAYQEAAAAHPGSPLEALTGTLARLDAVVLASDRLKPAVSDGRKFTARRTSLQRCRQADVPAGNRACRLHGVALVPQPTAPVGLTASKTTPPHNRPKRAAAPRRCCSCWTWAAGAATAPTWVLPPAC